MNKDDDSKQNVIYPEAFKRPSHDEPIEPIERINFVVTLDEIRILAIYRIASPKGKDLLHTIVNTIAEKAGREKPFD